jgi:hypothetical protein
MKLDFAALSGPAAVQPAHKPWGQVGTAGTQALVRVPACPGAGDRPGTRRDGAAIAPRNTKAKASVDGLSAGPCPQVSPPRPHYPTTCKPNEINVSPASPLVPTVGSTNARGEDFDRGAFEERAAIMEFDGGLTRAEAEAAALALLLGVAA